MHTRRNTFLPILPACLVMTGFPIAADLKVGCVGNSITAGMGISASQSYPTQMDGILGTGYAVTNYGNSGKTMLRDVNDAYWKQPEFTKVFADKPDVIVIELGTNDSKDYIWPYNKQNFKRDYKAMIDTFRTISTKPAIWITLQPRANNPSWGMPDTTIARQVNPLIRQVALEKVVGLIDLRTGFNGHPDWYQSDSVHPNAAGAKGMANVIGAMLKHAPLEILRPISGGALSAPEGFGYQWYRNDTLLAGDSAKELKSKVYGSYKVSVKIERNTESRIVTAAAFPSGIQVRERRSPTVRAMANGEIRIQGEGIVGSTLRVRDAHGRLVVEGIIDGEAVAARLHRGLHVYSIAGDGIRAEGKILVP